MAMRRRDDAAMGDGKNGLFFTSTVAADSFRRLCAQFWHTQGNVSQPVQIGE
jgi:hypothetical protein